MHPIIALSPLLENALATLIFSVAIVGFLAFVVYFQAQLATLFLGLARFCKAHFGANWRTTLTAIATALFAGLTGLAAMPYDLGPIADIIPPKAKSTVVAVGGVATVILHILNGFVQKDRAVTGGAIQQDTTGQVAQVQAPTPAPPAPAVPKV